MFHKLQSQEAFPEQVRCVHCGQMAQVEDLDYSDGDWVCCIYACDCSWLTEWEITCDGTNGIQSSSLFFRNPDNEDVISWYEARDWPGFWMPDGDTVPDEALKPLGSLPK